MANSYPKGANVNFFGEFKDPLTGAYVDPTTVTFMIRSPENGAITTYVYPAAPPPSNITHTAAGKYRTNFTLDFPGDWPYRWEGAGAYVGAAEGKVCVWTMF